MDQLDIGWPAARVTTILAILGAIATFLGIVNTLGSEEFLPNVRRAGRLVWGIVTFLFVLAAWTAAAVVVFFVIARVTESDEESLPPPPTTPPPTIPPITATPPPTQPFATYTPPPLPAWTEEECETFIIDYVKLANFAGDAEQSFQLSWTMLSSDEKMDWFPGTLDEPTEDYRKWWQLELDYAVLERESMDLVDADPNFATVDVDLTYYLTDGTVSPEEVTFVLGRDEAIGIFLEDYQP